MAEDNSARYRSNDSFGRGPTQGAPASDPLAELARLIGRNDPFSGYGQAAASPTPAPPPVRPEFSPVPSPPPATSHGYPPVPQPADPPPSFLSRPAPQFDSAPPRYAEPPHYAEPVAPQSRYSEPPPQEPYASEPTRYVAGFPAHNDWPGSSAPAQPGQSYSPPPDLFAKLQQELAGQPATPRYEHHDAHHPEFGGQSFADAPGRPLMDRGHASAPAGYEPAPFPGGMDRPGFGPPFLQEPSASQPRHDEDDFYDEEPRGPRRHGLATVFAVLGLAVLGTAGAFAYRSMVGGPRVASAPPVIRASGEPSKVAPPPAAVTDSSTAGKFSYDRFGDAGKDEKVVNREEKPVDLSKAVAPPSVARPAFPPPPVPNSAAAAPKGQVAAAPAAANPPSALGEPRRVKTVPIRPDQGGDAATAAPAQQPPSPTRQQANAQAQSVDPVPAARTKVAARQQPAPAAPPPAGGGPLSLSPDANNSAAQDFPAAPPAAAPSRPVAAAPARVASAPVAAAPAATAAAAGGGKFLVQVASQKSEADAETAYRGVQSKYGSVLSGQQHQIRRADLGAKGVYYRAMVGPFASREDAVQLCANLKQAGGDCVVQH